MGSTNGLLRATHCTPSHTIAFHKKSRNSAASEQCSEMVERGSRTDCGSGCRRFESDHSLQSSNSRGQKGAWGAAFVILGLFSPKILLRSAMLGCFRKLSRSHVSCF